MTLFERTKETAKKRGMNLQSVAEAAGLSKNAIYQWRKDYQPREVTIKAVADVLGVSVDYLLGNTDEMHPSEDNEMEPTEVQLKGLFRHYSTENGLTDEQKKDLVNDLDDFMAARAKRLSKK